MLLSINYLCYSDINLEARVQNYSTDRVSRDQFERYKLQACVFNSVVSIEHEFVFFYSLHENKMFVIIYIYLLNVLTLIALTSGNTGENAATR